MDSVACNKACHGCTGPSASNCVVCAENHYLDTDNENICKCLCIDLHFVILDMAKCILLCSQKQAVCNASLLLIYFDVFFRKFIAINAVYETFTDNMQLLIVFMHIPTFSVFHINLGILFPVV